MCVVCGCSATAQAASAPSEHVRVDPVTGDLDYGAGAARVSVPGMSQQRAIRLEADVLGENDRIAGANRAHFLAHGITALNFVSSPGSGKTTLLCATIEALRARAPSLPVAVIEGDQQTSFDADRIRATGAPAIQVNTGKGCHLDARMVADAFARLPLHAHAHPHAHPHAPSDAGSHDHRDAPAGRRSGSSADPRNDDGDPPAHLHAHAHTHGHPHSHDATGAHAQAHRHVHHGVHVHVRAHSHDHGGAHAHADQHEHDHPDVHGHEHHGHGQHHDPAHDHAPPGGLLLIENVGNLVCPALWDLGEAAKVAILSVTEGEDKPLKYPDMFAASRLMILNKVDLLPHLRFDVERCIDMARRVNPSIEVLQLSATTGQGMDRWLDWLLAHAGADAAPADRAEATRPAQDDTEAALRRRIAELEAALAQAQRR